MTMLFTMLTVIDIKLFIVNLGWPASGSIRVFWGCKQNVMKNFHLENKPLISFRILKGKVVHPEYFFSPSLHN